jgi:AcrR family transcriptional regulator
MKAKRRKAQIAGLGEFARARKEANRRRLFEAAQRVFTRYGYLMPSVDDIAQEAGVSRQTFYSHFDGKLAIAMEYFEQQNTASLPLWTRIASEDFNDPAVVSRWITALFDHFEANRNTLRTFIEMGVVEPQFLRRVKELVPMIMEALGEGIPGFAAARGASTAARKRRVDAWLLLWHLREQCNLTATGFMASDRHLVTEAFTTAFLRIASADESTPRGWEPV